MTACEYCTPKRRLTDEAQRAMDRVHNGRRVFIIPEVECERCFHGWILTPTGSALAVLVVHFAECLKEEAAAKEKADDHPF